MACPQNTPTAVQSMCASQKIGRRRNNTDEDVQETDTTMEKQKNRVGESADEQDCCNAIRAEESAKCWIIVLSADGEQFEPSVLHEDPRDSFAAFVRYEVAKDRSFTEAPPHIALMKQLELVQFVEGADSGNFCFAPRGNCCYILEKTYSFPFPGVLVKSLIEQLVVNQLLDYGAHVVQSPNFYDMAHPALKSYLDRFPARQYKVLSGDKPYFLRFSACFGQFLFLSQSVISHKALPVKCLEVSEATFSFFHCCTNQISDRTSLST